MMANGTTIIGLFQGLFDRNILTFNPGLAQDMSQATDFTDMRAILASLVADGIGMHSDTEPEGTPPGSIVFADPDGNPILVDQFFPKPVTGGAQGSAGEAPAPPCGDLATEGGTGTSSPEGSPGDASPCECRGRLLPRAAGQTHQGGGIGDLAWALVSAHCRSLGCPTHRRAS